MLIRWRVPLLLAIACLVLGGVMVSQQFTAMPPAEGSGGGGASDDASGTRATVTEAGADADHDSGDAAEASPDADGDAFSLPPVTAYSGIVERPLFNRTRRPAPPKEDATAEGATGEVESPFLLSGVMISGARRIALLQTRASPKTIRVEEGETVEGWKVQTIRPSLVTLVNGTNKHDLPLPIRIGAPAAPTGMPRQPGAPPGSEAPRQPNVAKPMIMPPGRPTEQAPQDVDTDQQ